MLLGIHSLDNVKIFLSSILYNLLLALALLTRVFLGRKVMWNVIRLLGVSPPLLVRRLNIRHCILVLYGSSDKLKFIVRPLRDDFGSVLLDGEDTVCNLFDPKSGDNVVDVGAHLGGYTIRAAKKVGRSGRVVAVEPNPDSARILELVLGINGLDNVVVVRSAAWNAGTTLEFTVTPAASSGSHVRGMLPPHATEDLQWITVPAKKLDDLLLSLEIDRVDWLKIDVEGAEIEVLEGALETLRRTLNVIVEVFPKNLPRTEQILRASGFALRGLGRYYEDAVHYIFARRAIVEKGRG